MKAKINLEKEKQRGLSARLRELHQSTRVLVLPNAWDVASARIFEKAGFSAIGTTSAGIAFSMGFPDGQRISRTAMLEVVGRIAARVSLPVTADMESGHGRSIGDVAETARAVLEAGGVGINIEDAGGDPGVHAAKIRAVRETVDSAGVPLVINARVDLYLVNAGEAKERFDRTVERAAAYLKSAADCVFVPGVRDAEIIRRLISAIDGPVNMLAGPGAPTVAELERLGVRRVSVGSGPMRAALALTARIARELLNDGTYRAFSDAMPYAEANRLFEEVS